MFVALVNRIVPRRIGTSRIGLVQESQTALGERFNPGLDTLDPDAMPARDFLGREGGLVARRPRQLSEFGLAAVRTRVEIGDSTVD